MRKEIVKVLSDYVKTDEAIINEAMNSSVMQDLLMKGTKVHRTIIMPVRDPSRRGVNFVTK